MNDLHCKKKKWHSLVTKEVSGNEEEEKEESNYDNDNKLTFTQSLLCVTHPRKARQQFTEASHQPYEVGITIFLLQMKKLKQKG